MGRYILNTATGAASPAVYVKQYDRDYALDFEIRNGSEIRFLDRPPQDALWALKKGKGDSAGYEGTDFNLSGKKQ